MSRRKPAQALPERPSAARSAASGRVAARYPHLAPIAGLLALFALVAGPYIARCFTSWVPGGWDGVAHFSVAELYARKVFPACSGWLSEYFGGMPFPDFYPPLFYFLVAALIRAGLAPDVAFLGFQTLLSAAVPVLTYLCAQRVARSRLAGFVAGALAIAFLVDRHPIASFGISLQATFGIGLSTQLLAFCFTLLFYYCFLGAESSRRQAALASLFLAGVALTNVHVVWDAAFLFVGLAGARAVAATDAASRRRSLATSFAVGAAGVALSAAWVLPMLARLAYVPTMALDPPPGGLVLHAFFRLGVYLVLGSVAAWVNRDAPALGLAASLVLLAASACLPTSRLVENLALQPGRFLIAFEFTAPILVGYLIASIRQLTAETWVRVAAAGACLGAFLLYIRPVDAPFGNISARQGADYQQVLAPLAGKRDARVLVEMGTGAPSDSFGLQALLGRAGALSLTTVFRESTPSVLFAAPLRNVFSTRQDNFGVDTKTPPGEELAGQGVAQQLARLRSFNVGYFVTKTPEARARVMRLPGAHRISPNGTWEAFAIDPPGGGFAEVPAAAPVLTFASWSVKKRPEVGFDFVRLGEELFSAGRLEPLLALAHTGKLDREDFRPFALALVTDYRYDSLERAYQALESFSREHPVVLLESTDPLFARLAELAHTRPRLQLVPRGPVADRAGVSRVAGELFARLDALRVPLEGAPRVVAAELEGPRARIELSAAPASPLPLWVKQGYLPGWRTKDGSPLYLASPCFQLVLAGGREVELELGAPRMAGIGWALSLAACGALMLIVVRGRFFPARREPTST